MEGYDYTTAVSVIIPTYNRAKYLSSCLESLSTQTFKNFEVIISDDGSTDNTKEVVQQYSDRLQIRYIYSENFGGPARPRNIGIRYASGMYIAFLDSDDEWLPTKLQRSIDRLNQGFDLVYHPFYRLIPLGGFAKMKVRLPARKLHSPVYKDLLVNGNPIVNSSVVVRKSVLDKVGKISEDKNLIAAEDFDYWLRISMQTDNFGFIDDALGIYGTSSDSLIKQPNKVLQNLDAICHHHVEPMVKNQHLKFPTWLNYFYGRVYHRLGEKKKASKYLKKVLKSKGHLFIKCKAGATLLLQSLK